LAVDFVKDGRAGVRQRGISSGIEQWAGMLQALHALNGLIGWTQIVTRSRMRNQGL
jgi:hypothetical protein